MLVLLYAALSAATIAVIAVVPGVPFYSEGNSVEVSIAVEALLVLFLLRGSLLAWCIAAILSAGGPALDVFSMLFGSGGLGFEPKASLTGLLEVAAVIVLTSSALGRSLSPSATAERRSIGSI